MRRHDELTQFVRTLGGAYQLHFTNRAMQDVFLAYPKEVWIVWSASPEGMTLPEASERAVETFGTVLQDQRKGQYGPRTQGAT